MNRKCKNMLLLALVACGTTLLIHDQLTRSQCTLPDQEIKSSSDAIAAAQKLLLDPSRPGAIQLIDKPEAVAAFIGSNPGCCSANREEAFNAVGEWSVYVSAPLEHGIVQFLLALDRCGRYVDIWKDNT